MRLWFLFLLSLLVAVDTSCLSKKTESSKGKKEQEKKLTPDVEMVEVQPASETQPASDTEHLDVLQKP